MIRGVKGSPGVLEKISIFSSNIEFPGMIEELEGCLAASPTVLPVKGLR
jgi:hypothetical protein